MDEEFVNGKTLEHLHTEYFTKLDKDPSEDIEKEAHTLLDEIFEDPTLDIPPYLFKHLYPNNTSSPSIQPLLKDHKPDFPNCKIRPIQPVTRSAIDSLDIALSHILTQVRPFLTHRIDNAQEAQERLKKVNHVLPNSYIIASLDITNMYPNMPIDSTALNVIREYLIKCEDKINLFGLKIDSIMKILKFVLEHTYVAHKDHYYMQSWGIGTGLHTSCCYSEILVNYTYNKALDISTSKPLSLSNYVDDSLLIWSDKDSFNTFKNIINNIWPTLNFEEELETTNGLTFLDMRIKRDINNKITYLFHQKPTHSGHYLHFTSHCSMNIKTNLIKNEASRINRNCKNRDDIWPFLEKLKLDLLNSGYPEHIINLNILKGINENIYPPKVKKEHDYTLRLPFVNEGFTRIIKRICKKAELNRRVVTTPGKSIKSLIKPNKSKICTSQNCIPCKNNMPCEDTHYIYKFSCNNCPSPSNDHNTKPNFYVGASRRKLNKRLKEHEASVRRFNTRTSLGEHMVKFHEDLKPNTIKRKTDYNAFFTNFTGQIIDHGRDTLDTFLKENMAIKALKPKINTMLTNGFF